MCVGNRLVWRRWFNVMLHGPINRTLRTILQHSTECNGLDSGIVKGDECSISFFHIGIPCSSWPHVYQPAYLILVRLIFRIALSSN